MKFRLDAFYNHIEKSKTVYFILMFIAFLYVTSIQLASPIVSISIGLILLIMIIIEFVSLMKKLFQNKEEV